MGATNGVVDQAASKIGREVKFFIWLIIVYSTFFSAVVSGSTQQFQTIYYNKQTIQITLSVNHERVVKLPFTSRLHLQPSISKVLDVVIQDDILLLTAKKPFISGRAKVVSLSNSSSHPIILLSLSAVTEQVESQPVEIVVPSLVKRHAKSLDEAHQVGTNQPGIVSTPEHPYVSLSRYALQRAFVPERLLEVSYGVSNVNVFSGILPLYQGGELQTQIHSSYRKGELYATVVRVDNLIDKKVEIDPRKFRGRWLARSGFVYTLMPKGTSQSTTAFVLISDMPFEDAANHVLQVGGEGE